MNSYTIQELAHQVADAPAVAVFPESSPPDAMRRFFDGRDAEIEDVLADVIVVPCNSHEEASEICKELEAAFVNHTQIREDL